MMIYGNLRTAIAVTGMCFLVSVPAQAATIGEALDVMGDMVVLENLCPDLHKNMESVRTFMNENGITDSMLTETSIFSEELEAAAKRSFAARKLKTREENCADAIELYGVNGSKVKGHYVLKPVQGTAK